MISERWPTFDLHLMKYTQWEYYILSMFKNLNVILQIYTFRVRRFAQQLLDESDKLYSWLFGSLCYILWINCHSVRVLLFITLSSQPLCLHFITPVSGHPEILVMEDYNSYRMLQFNNMACDSAWYPENMLGRSVKVLVLSYKLTVCLNLGFSYPFLH